MEHKPIFRGLLSAFLTGVLFLCLPAGAAAREKDPGDIKAEMVVEGMRAHGINAIHTPTFNDTEAYLRAHWQPGDLVLTMGCGNINQLNDQIWENQQNHR